jgi:oligoendopeptidase F
MGIYRDALDPDHLHPYAWAAGPHNFMPNVSFYNFPYAFGMLFSLGLYAEYRRRGASFVPEYESLLASTGEVMPVELAARFGIDLRQPGFWRASLDLIGRRIQRFQELCTGLASTKQP